MLKLSLLLKNKVECAKTVPTPSDLPNASTETPAKSSKLEPTKGNENKHKQTKKIEARKSYELREKPASAQMCLRSLHCKTNNKYFPADEPQVGKNSSRMCSRMSS